MADSTTFPADASPKGEDTEGSEAPEAADGSNGGTGSRWRKLALRGSVFELAGYVASYGMRFVSSTVLRSLLFPAAFGLMEVINGVTIGLIMLSDVGIRQAIIQSKRGHEQVFLDTAWTMLAVRGVILTALACAVSYPAALLAGEPSLATLMPVAALGTVLLGFSSTSEMTLRREMKLGRVVGMEVVSQALSITVAIVWASYSPTVWALVAAGLVNVASRVVITYWLNRTVGYRNRFRWDAGVRKEIFDFGKWITASSAVFFVSNWADRLMLVAFLGATVSGVYATAVLIAESVGAALDKVIHGVFYPLFARVGEEGLDRLKGVYYATRLRFDALTMIATGALMVLGPWVIGFLFDDRYAEAGWMLQVLSIRTAFMCIVAPCETCLTSLGHTRYGFNQNMMRATFMLIGVPIGFYTWGVQGVVWVVALSGVPPLLALWPKFRELGLLRLDRELLAWVFFGVGAALGLLVSLALPEAQALRRSVAALLGLG